MKKIEVVTRPEKLVGLKEVLASHNCQGMTVTSVMWPSERLSSGNELYRRRH